jgi:hypothetical protein
MIVVLIALSFTYTHLTLSKINYKKNKLNEFFNVINEDKNNLYQFCMYSDLPFEAICGLNPFFKNRPKNYLYFGWLIGTPAYIDHINHLNSKGLIQNRNQFIHLINDKSTFLVSNNDFFNRNIVKFAKDHYNKKIELKFEKNINGIEIYKVK